MEQEKDRLQPVRVSFYIILTIALFFVFWNAIVDELNSSTIQSLEDVAAQSAVAIENELLEQQRLLYSLAEQFEECPRGQEKEWVNHCKGYIDIYSYIRIGYVNEEGMAYTTDGYDVDLSYRDFYQRSMQGESVITGVLEDSIGKEHENINVFSVPVYESDNTTTKGVLFATYRTSTLQKVLSVSSFDDNGFSMVLSDNGDLITSSAVGFQGEDDYEEELRSFREKNAKEITTINENMSKGASGLAYFSYRNDFVAYYTPITINNSNVRWYAFSAVPRSWVNSRVNPLMVKIGLVIGVALLAVVALSVTVALAKRKGQLELFRLAYEDSITKGSNYSYFKKKLEKNREKFGYFISMDLSQFKIVNNTCGRSVGDDVILQVWEVIAQNLKKGEEAAHINADHYVLLLLERDRQQLIYRLDVITEAVEQISMTQNLPVFFPYYGAYANDGEEDVEICYSRANQAKHMIKGRRDCNYAFYDEVDLSKVLENKRLEDSFEQAIEKEQFVVYYQPKYSADKQLMVGAEALIRWIQDDGSMIGPYKFIPLFEKNGMIVRLDEYVFEKVCRDLCRWRDEGKELVPISINVSRASLHYSGIVEKYGKIVQKYELPKELVQIEITESAMIDNSDIKSLVDEFHNANFKLLLDDFGNGYSSLATLNVLRFDILKIDKSLVDYIGNKDGERLLASIIELAQNLGFHITAEGVETKVQLDFLYHMKCDDIQGYYFSKPLPRSDFEKLL